MNRRNFSSTMLGVALAGATLKLEKPERPLLAVLKIPEDVDVSDLVIQRIQLHWDRLWKGAPPFPLLILTGGCELEIREDPRCTAATF